MSEMETTTEQRAGLMHTLSILENTPDDSRDAEVMRKLCRDLDRATARIAELEATPSAEYIRGLLSRIAGLEAEVARLHEMFRDIGIGAVYGRDGWRPIDTAPTDGTVILLSDGVRFAAGAREFRIEKEWRFLGYDEGLKYPNGQPKIGPRFDEKVPNPDAGKRHEWWGLYGGSAWSRDTDIEDDDGNCFFEPVYWMPVPARPAP